jgi:mevalonate kinase
MKPSVFYAKIMLFGEYGVIWNSMALTIPYAHFSGALAFINDEQYTRYEFAVESNRHLRDYLGYLKELRNDPAFGFEFNLEGLEKDIDSGLYFESNIPQGYGIGSSGALVAAIYDEYQAANRSKGRKIFTETEIAVFRENFAKMESYFHGTSSGLDPLLCYIRHPLLIRSRKQIETVSIPRGKFGSNSAIFLVDTGVLGKTGPLVNLFREKCREEKYLERVEKVMIPANDGCIVSLLEGTMDDFFVHLSGLSAFQYESLNEMIPAHMMPYWDAGLQRDDFKLKLCGSGGGGFLLGISRDFSHTRDYFRQQGLELIPVYKNDLL